MSKKVALHNLGCKVNAYEVEAMQQLLEKAGYEIVPFEEGADIYLINTCTVTNIADRKSRQMLHKAKKMNPNAIVVATGCYVQTDTQKLEEDSAVDLILGNNQKKQIVEALDIMERENVDLILLDVMMPRLNGLSALMKLREKSRIPVIILSAKTEESDKVSGLTLGADDYIEKPYNPAELIARVKAHLRRYRAWSGGETEKKKDPDQIVNGGLVLDKKQRVIFVEGEEVHLTATEYKILELLMTHPGQVFPAEQIYENVWQETADYTVENTVMVHIRHIREKVEIDAKKPRYVKVVWGIGYKMEKYGKSN